MRKVANPSIIHSLCGVAVISGEVFLEDIVAQMSKKQANGDSVNNKNKGINRLKGDFIFDLDFFYKNQFYKKFRSVIRGQNIAFRKQVIFFCFLHLQNCIPFELG
jgi:hypothetical protein